MSIYSEYREKLKTAESAVACIQSGEWVDYGANNSMPYQLDEALAQRKEELHAVKVRGNLLPGPVKIAECDPDMNHFVYHTWHCSSYERKLVREGKAFFTPMLFRDLEWYYDNYLSVDTAMIAVPPMDEKGYFNLSGAMGALPGIIKNAKRLILEINEALPVIPGGPETKVHISRVDMIVEGSAHPLMQMRIPTIQEADRKIAENIFPFVMDGATLQIGIGSIPNALGMLMASSELKKLSMHTELCSDPYYMLSQCGKLSGGVLGMAIGTDPLYRWVDRNQDLCLQSLTRVNSPAILSGIDNLISVNGCLGVDLYGQVNSESVYNCQISGTGGQLDFVEGASHSRGGKSFLCMHSTYKNADGSVQSNIMPVIEKGIVTTPRTQTQYIVTEYGAINLMGLSTWERADKLISIAHPQFRESLIQYAQAQNIWLPSNKR